MSEWDGPATQYEITVAGDDDVLDDIAVAVRAWANVRGRRFFVWRAMPKEAPAAPAAPGIDVEYQRLLSIVQADHYSIGWKGCACRTPNCQYLVSAARLANPEKP